MGSFRLPGLFWRIYHRTANRILDSLAVLLGYCNARPGKGGYAHWRCLHKRGHYPGVLHRFKNYAWDEDGPAVYAPLAWRSPLYERYGRSTLRDRYCIRTMREERRFRSEMERRFREQRAARTKGEA